MKYSNNRKKKERERIIWALQIYIFSNRYFSEEDLLFFLAKLKRFSYIYFLDLKINIDKFLKIIYYFFLPNKMNNNKNKEFKNLNLNERKFNEDNKILCGDCSCCN